VANQVDRFPLSRNKVRAVIEKVFADRTGALDVDEEFTREKRPDQADAAQSSRPIHVASRRKKRGTLEKAWPGALGNADDRERLERVYS
jgi:hypothetical protein